MILFDLIFFFLEVNFNKTCFENLFTISYLIKSYYRWYLNNNDNEITKNPPSFKILLIILQIIYNLHQILYVL